MSRLQSLLQGSPTFAELVDELRSTLPLLDELSQTPQDPEWHAEGNVAVHSGMVLAEALNLSGELSGDDRCALLLAAALHDIGKALTTREEVGEDGVLRVRSPHHARRGRNYLSYRLLETSLPSSLILTVLGLVGEHHSVHRAVEGALEGTGGRGVWALARRVSLPLLVPLSRADLRGRVVRQGSEARSEDAAELLQLMAQEAGIWENVHPYADFRADIVRLLPDAPPDLIALACGRGVQDWEKGIIHTPHEVVARVQQAWKDGFPRLTVMMGPSGSGKSTLAQQFDGAEIVSLDAWRARLGKHSSDQTVNGQVMQAAREQLREGLRRKRHVVWDATSLRRSGRSQVLGLGEDYGALTELHVMWTRPSELLARDRERERTVGGAVIVDQLRGLEFPTVDEAHRVVFHG